MWHRIMLMRIIEKICGKDRKVTACKVRQECEFMRTEAFAKKVQQSDNYFVLVSRESFPMLPYSITEIISL